MLELFWCGVEDNVCLGSVAYAPSFRALACGVDSVDYGVHEEWVPDEEDDRGGGLMPRVGGVARGSFRRGGNTLSQ